MKKIVSAVALAMMTLSFVACKKEYTCSCEVVQEFEGEELTRGTQDRTIKDTKKKAEDQCAAGNVNQDITYMGMNVKQSSTCVLK